MDQQILDAVEMLHLMQGCLTPHIMYLSKSYRLLSKHIHMEDYFHESWLNAHDELMEFLHTLTVIHSEHRPPGLTDEELRQAKEIVKTMVPKRE